MGGDSHNTRKASEPGQCSWSCNCEWHVQKGVSVFDDDIETCFEMKMEVSERVHDFKSPPNRTTPSAVPNVDFVVIQEPGMGFGVCMRRRALALDAVVDGIAASSSTGRRKRHVVARTGDLIGMITGVISPPASTVRQNSYTWDIDRYPWWGANRDIESMPTANLDASVHTTVCSIINSDASGQSHNCCGVSHDDRAVVLIFACQDIMEDEPLRLSYSKDASPLNEPALWVQLSKPNNKVYASASGECFVVEASSTVKKTLSKHRDYYPDHVWFVVCDDFHADALAGKQFIDLARPATLAEWIANPMKCLYDVAKADAKYHGHDFGNVLVNTYYWPCRGMMYTWIPLQTSNTISSARGNRHIAIPYPIELMPSETAKSLYINLHTWEDGSPLTIMSLFEAPPQR